VDKVENNVPPKRLLIFNRLYGAMSQKIELFLVTAVRALNPVSP
jgi:hypothetical protein